MRADADIGRFGRDERGRALFFIQWRQQFGMPCLRLVAIDDFGNVEPTPVYKPWDPAAMTREQAIVHHLEHSGAVDQADADLERRRKDHAEREPEPPQPQLDPATRRWLADD